ncbi:hypothetical protein K7H05_54095, partial [Bacillus sp. ZZQ-131]
LLYISISLYLILTQKELKKTQYANMHIVLTALHGNLEIPAKKKQLRSANSAGFFSYLTSYLQALRSR